MSQQHKAQGKTDALQRHHMPDAMTEEYIQSDMSEQGLADLASHNHAPLTPNNVIQLQRKLGNQATMQIINRQPKLTTQNTGTTPFAGLKMVTPGTIQREPNGGGGDEDKDEQTSSKPDEAVELDGGDKENNQESQEIDQTINKAKDVIGGITGIGDEIVGFSTGDDVDDDDEWSVSYNEDHDPIGPSPDDVNGTKLVGKPNVKMNPNAVNTADDDDNMDATWKPQGGHQNKVIKQQQKHKQKKGTVIKGKTLASESPLDAVPAAGIDIARNVNTGIAVKDATKAIKDASSLKDALSAVTDTSTDVGAEGIIGKLQKFLGVLNVPPLNILISIGTLIFRVASAKIKHTQMKAFKKLMEAGGGDTSLRKGILADKQTVGSYAYAKTKRGFWLRVIKAAINAGEIIARMITLISGGTAALVTEATAVAMGLSNGIIKVGQSLKGIYKMIRGKRGKRRLESANWIVDGAIDGDQDLLQLLLDLDVVSGIWLDKRSFILTKNQKPGADKAYIKKLADLTRIPADKQQMQNYLKLLEEVDGIASFKGRVAAMTKST